MACESPTMLTVLDRFTPSEVVDMSREKEWASALG